MSTSGRKLLARCVCCGFWVLAVGVLPSISPAGQGEDRAALPASAGPAPVLPAARKLPWPTAVPILLPAAEERTISLAEALQQAGVVNPTIALAWEQVRASQAEQLLADVLLVPTLHAGAGVDAHWGILQSSTGALFDVNRQVFYAGAGAAAMSAGTVGIPGVWLSASLTEAWFEPQATRWQVQSRRYDALATRNDVLLAVTERYLALVGAEARLRALRASEEDLIQVVRLTTAYFERGQGREADAQRARAELFLLQAELAKAQEESAGAAAELARLLDLDPSVRLRPADAAIPLIELVSPQEDLARLVQIALANRPEVRARAAEVALWTARLREERFRPLLPDLAVGFSAGDFGGAGSLPGPHPSDLRLDFDAVAVWPLENLGLGNLATLRQRRAQLAEAQTEQARTLARIRQQVAQAQANVRARRGQLDLAQRQLRIAQEGYQLDFQRIRNIVAGQPGRPALPIELLNNLHFLVKARQDLVTALVQYDQAQFELYVALGQPPSPPSPLSASSAARSP